MSLLWLVKKLLQQSRWGVIRTLSGASLIAQTVKNLIAMQETWVQSWVRKISWRKEWLPIPVLEKPQGQRSLAGYSPWGHRVGHKWVTNISTFRAVAVKRHITNTWWNLVTNLTSPIWLDHYLGNNSESKPAQLLAKVVPVSFLFYLPGSWNIACIEYFQFI